MNPCSTDQGGSEDYSGSEPLDPALADRFALVVTASRLGGPHQRAAAGVVAPSGEGVVTPRNDALCDAVGRWRELFTEQANACPRRSTSYVTTVMTALNGAGVRLSPRRARLLTRSLLAATIVAGRASTATFERARVQPAARAWGQRRRSAVVAAAHRLAWDASREGRVRGSTRSSPSGRRASSRCCSTECPDPDTGLAGDAAAARQRVSRSAPPRLRWPPIPRRWHGRLPIGAEGVNDLAACGAAARRRRRAPLAGAAVEKGTSHPVIASLGRC